MCRTVPEALFNFSDGSGSEWHVFSPPPFATHVLNSPEDLHPRSENHQPDLLTAVTSTRLAATVHRLESVVQLVTDLFTCRRDGNRKGDRHQADGADRVAIGPAVGQDISLGVPADRLSLLRLPVRSRKRRRGRKRPLRVWNGIVDGFGRGRLMGTPPRRPPANPMGRGTAHRDFTSDLNRQGGNRNGGNHQSDQAQIVGIAADVEVRGIAQPLEHVFLSRGIWVKGWSEHSLWRCILK